jgi:hypothetical protein
VAPVCRSNDRRGTAGSASSSCGAPCASGSQAIDQRAIRRALSAVKNRGRCSNSGRATPTQRASVASLRVTTMACMSSQVDRFGRWVNGIVRATQRPSGLTTNRGVSGP